MSLFAWSAASFALGIAVRFSPLGVPMAWVVVGLGLCGFALLGKRFFTPAVSYGVLFALFAALGFLRAEWRVRTLDTPVLAEDTAVVLLEARVREVSGRVGHARMVLDRLTWLDSLPASSSHLPRRVSVRLRSHATPEIGSRIRLRVRLLAPSEPILPDGFNFRRHARLKGIGAYGYTLGSYRVVRPVAEDLPISLRLSRLRASIGARLDRHLGARAPIARALLIGDRDAVPRPALQQIRDSGLAHILAISGLHLGLVAFGSFVLLRRLGALFPSFALRFPLKKLAAGVALCAAGAYMVLAGATIPTQRAFVMSALVLFAVLLDRTALSLRLVAVAAVVVLALTPEGLLSAGFHMSFAAAATLVAFYDLFRGRRSILPWFLRRPMLLLSTTIVASVSTAPFVLLHFGRIAQFGLLANMVVVPLLGLWVLPLGALSLVLMPLGLEAFPARAMGLGIGVIESIASYVSSLPHSVFYTKATPAVVLPLLGLGLFLVIFSARSAWRDRALTARGWFCGGCALLFIAAVVWLQAPQAIALVGGDRPALWVRGHSDVYWRAGGRQSSFEFWAWMRYLGHPRVRGLPSRRFDVSVPSGRLRCRLHRCVLDLGTGRLFLSRRSVRFSCFEDERDCRSFALDSGALRDGHAVVLFARGGGVSYRAARSSVARSGL